MSQAAGFSINNAVLEISSNGSSWTDVSGFFTSVGVDGGDLQTDDTYTGEVKTALITKGKHEPYDITVSSVYTEGVSDIFNLLWAAFKADTPYYVRWTPKGAGTGNKIYTANGFLTNVPPPQGEMGDAKAILFEWGLHVADIAQSAAA